MSSAPWSGQDQQSLAAASGGDFHQFLDMNGINGMGNLGDGINFDFQGFQNFHGAGAQAIMSQPRQSADTVMGNTSTEHQPALVSNSDGLLQNNVPSNAISLIDAQIQYLQQQKFEQQQRQMHEQQHSFFGSTHGHPPLVPTPQSLDMTPGSVQSYPKSDQMSSRSAFERGYHQHMVDQQDMAFTPLVSPAVTPLTPLDPHFNMDGAFVLPNTYFSPLTSPALLAQMDPHLDSHIISSPVYDHSTHSNNSPVEMDLESGLSQPASSWDLAKKARRNNASKIRSKPAIKSSPITKPQRRKTGPSPAVVSQVLSELDESNLPAADQGLLPLPAASTDGSDENASVSPENLTDMPPPPIPTRQSKSTSPYIQAQGSNIRLPAAEASAGGSRPPPATPASLMKLAASGSTKPTTSPLAEPMVSDNIDSLELPESVSTNPQPIHIQPQPQPQPQPQFQSQSPRIDAKSAKRASLVSLPSPSIRAPPPGTSTASQSPLLQPGASSTPSFRKTPLLSSRSRKRSLGSIHVSPALLPRISPNIKPLLPGGAGLSAEDQASRLLMSKSNYQNILEGNQVPGVSYPSELSTNITSKRTSHKIAEQGRRNRINSALQVMAGLLPESSKNKSSSGGEEESDKKESKQAHVSNSKASVVENAIVHMRNLEKENGELRKELRALRDELEKLRGKEEKEDLEMATDVGLEEATEEQKDG